MKSLFSIVGILSSVSALAIVFITEDQVARKLGAQKVIEVSKYSVESLLDAGSDCMAAFPSRSARAYVVKQGNKASLYLTPEDLNHLTFCKSL